MKPAFALSFSTTGITLHHQSDDDWYVVGSIPLDAEDLPEQMQALREKAFALENDLSCKVVLPADQVRFLDVETGELPPDEREARIEAALADSTPYALSDLSYDSQTIGSTSHIAVVANETLAEARSFTAGHGFVPTLFSAEESAGSFPREPVFTEQPDQPHATLTSEPDEADSHDEADTPGLPAHPIAGTVAPETFRAPDTSPAAHATSSPASKRYAIPAFAAVVLLSGAFGAWLASGPTDQPEQAELSPTAPEVSSSEAPPEPEPEIAVVQPEQTFLPESSEETSEQAELNSDAPDPEVAPEPDPEVAAVDAQQNTPPEPPAEEAEAQPELSPTDAAILEALKVAPTPVEPIAQDPDAPKEILAETGIDVSPPAPLQEPEIAEHEDLYLTSIDKSDLSTDAVALPPASSFDTDEPFQSDDLPSVAGSRFDLDDRGLVVPTPEGALNPEGITVYLGRPSKAPPQAPLRFEEEPVVEEVDQRLAGLRPKPRPGDIEETFERQQLGGQSLAELAGKRPKARPAGLEAPEEVEVPVSELAIMRVPRPKPRPAGLVAARPTVAKPSTLASTAALVENSDDAESFQPKTVAPKIPSTASVARQATIDNAINLRRLNLIGVYGTPANRRALVRLPSGRYKKLKVGDRIDGGKVIAISDSELRYQKKGRNVTLSMPRS
ncbi:MULTISPECIES: hypothetical protein [unclassified Ruegeria]|uniref:hypothetical protein n=1 Tax=unclassified Ruegeria TaxID=2625375 RepID=UPI0014911628|nr:MULTISPECIES: hypothetical protein [unclassified Ruegeria]NOD45944.1 hypothetical protein [Ruegeria sp. HKCCD5849]NOD50756.1 hypothetical protein [Ruegeria sp. HKCCD5851]NOD67572.1 hypothetical protein [Ruegeria sp. HKCCD7303]NOE33158.1 hypothetical protein [Ruegeria sp. HKCCD7318]